MSKKIYLAGKVTGLPDEAVQVKFRAKQEELTAKGYQVFNPVHHVMEMGLDTCSWQDIMRELIPHLCTKDEIHMLPCWQESRGAVLERDIAIRLGITVVYH